MIWHLIQNWQFIIGAAIYAVLIIVAWRALGWRGALAVATLGVAHYAYNQGRKREAQRYDERNQAAKDTRSETDREVNSLDDDAVRDRLSRWMRD